MNPFEATDTFIDKKEQLIKEQKAEKAKQEADAIKLEKEKTIKKQMEEELARQKEEAKAMEAKKAMELKKAQEAKEAAKQMDKKAAQAPVQKMQKEIALKPKPKPIVPKVKKVIIEDEEFKVLPFVNIYTVQNTLMIEVDKKYKLVHQEALPKQKKLLFDYKGKKSFYTIRKPIKNTNYKSFAVGTHLKKNFFRVVIDLEDNTTMYRKSIDTQNGIVAIQKLRKRK
jgi:hypothetical protein